MEMLRATSHHQAGDGEKKSTQYDIILYFFPKKKLFPYYMIMSFLSNFFFTNFTEY